jgi:hypothetical protein
MSEHARSGHDKNLNPRKLSAITPHIARFSKARPALLPGSLPLLDEIKQLDRAGLISLWQALFGNSPPSSISQPFMRKALAFEVQVRTKGGLPRPLMERIKTLDQPCRSAAKPIAAPGTRLLREWNGVTHIVDVEPDGIRYQNRLYRSLTAVAREITGTHWSGPRFFGVTS